MLPYQPHRTENDDIGDHAHYSHESVSWTWVFNNRVWRLIKSNECKTACLEIIGAV